MVGAVFAGASGEAAPASAEAAATALPPCDPEYGCDPCLPEGCNGRCGLVDDGCGGPLDCGSCNVCGNGVCQGDETPETCPQDCPAGGDPVCNHDDVCQDDETIGCSDCWDEEPICGDGVVEEGETCSSCPADVALRPTFTVSPSSPRAGEPVTLTAHLVRDPPSPRWDLGNAQHREGNPSIYAYPDPGTFTIRLTAQDARCWSEQIVGQTVHVAPGPPAVCGDGVCTGGETPSSCPEDCGLVVDAGGPYSALAAQPVSFAATVGTAAPATYQWDFGDGTTGTTRTPTHTYAASGTYTATVTAITASADGSDSATVTIAEPPTCGNGVVDDGETCESCPQDVVRKPSFTATPLNPFVNEQVTFVAASDELDTDVVPLWDRGDTTHGAGNPDFHTYTRADLFSVVLTARDRRCEIETRTHQLLRVRERPQCDFSDLPPEFQICCGNENCEAGEQLNPGACPQDCPRLQVDAGGPYEAEPGQPVQFRPTITGSNETVRSYLWTFDDGTTSSEPAPMHVYSIEGRYDAQLHVATESESGSDLAEVTIGSTALPGDDAEILEWVFPEEMVPGATYNVSVKVRNNGISRWISDHDAPDGVGYALGVKAGDLLTVGTRFTLPPGQDVEEDETFTFEFVVVAPTDKLGASAILQMLNGQRGWFGLAEDFAVRLDGHTPGLLRVTPDSGPPGTLVTIDLVGGPVFVESADVRFAFGNPRFPAFSRVSGGTAVRLSTTQMTFEVPETAGCGDHYLSVGDRPDGMPGIVDPYRAERFTVTAPCDPARRNSLDVLTYNVQFMPAVACNFAFVKGGSPVRRCPSPLPWCDDCYKSERTPLIAGHADVSGHDVLVLQEAFSGHHTDELLRLLNTEYPYRTRTVGDVTLPDATFTNGGVLIASKWPIVEAEHVFRAKSGFWDDERASKGVIYGRVNKGGVRYHVFGTHLDAHNGDGDHDARRAQLLEMRNFALEQLQDDHDPVLFAGDFNIDKNLNPGGTYDLILERLEATLPPTTPNIGTACPTPLPAPPSVETCQDDFDCGQTDFYAGSCREGRPPLFEGTCEYTKLCGFGTNLSGDWIDYVFRGGFGAPVPVFAENRVLAPRHPDSPYPSDHLSDHFPVLGRFRYDFPQNLPGGPDAAPASAPLASAPNATVANPTPKFEWGSVADASSYTLLVRKTEEQVTLLQEARIAGESFVPHVTLPADVDLDWQVRAENEVGPGPDSPPMPFRIERDPAGPPVAAPAAAWPLGTTRLARPTFRWTAVPGATTYTLQAATTSGLSAVLEHASISGTAFVPFADLPAGVPLFWTVRAENVAGAGPWSQPAHFSIDPNDAPAVTITHAGTCDATGCAVTFSVEVIDPDGDSTQITWSGCGTGSGATLTCVRSSPGPVEAQAVVSDGRGESVTVWDASLVAVAAYATGPWSECVGTGSFTCTSNTPTGCSRPGTQARSVAVESWGLDVPGVPAPGPVQDCRQTAQGYIAAYDATYADSWTCTAAGENGCYKDRTGATPSAFDDTAPDAALPAARLYTTGYVATWGTGDWSECTRGCGGGWQYRTVWPTGFKATSPDAQRPADGQPCNTAPCLYTCGDYSLYETKWECRGDGWPNCVIRYKNRGDGSLLTCWAGTN
jgi:PKD repeat protein